MVLCIREPFPVALAHRRLPDNVVPLRANDDSALEARSDDELMLLARGGQRRAFDVLVRRHQAASLKLAARGLCDTAAARDACQAAFLELYRGLDRYEPRGRFVFYLRVLVLNHCRMHGRRSRLDERARTESAAIDLRVLDPRPAPDEALLAAERRREIDRAMSGLSEKLREVVALRYAAGHSLEEVAQLLELPVGTVKSRLFAAMRQLKDRLSGEAS